MLMGATSTLTVGVHPYMVKLLAAKTATDIISHQDRTPDLSQLGALGETALSRKPLK